MSDEPEKLKTTDNESTETKEEKKPERKDFSCTPETGSVSAKP